MKKLLSVFLVFSLFFSICVPAFSAGELYLVTAETGAPLLRQADEQSGRLALIRKNTILSAEAASKDGRFIQVRYDGYSGFVSLSHLEKYPSETVKEIRVKSMPKKTIYFEEDEFSSEGLAVTAVFADGREREIQGYTVHVPDMNWAGQKMAQVVYRGQRTEFPITIQKIPIDRLEMTTPPKSTLLIEDSDLNLEGMILTAYFTDGREPRTIENYQIAGFDNQKVGIQNISIYYKYPEFSVPLTVEVVKKSVTNLVIEELPKKTVYYDDNEEIDLEGLVLRAYYNNGKSEIVNPEAAVFKNPLVVGVNNTVVLTYGGKTVEYSVGFRASEPVGIEVETPDNLSCPLGSQPDFASQIAVYLVYNSGRKERITDFAMDTPDTSKFGKKSLNVYYQNYSAGFSYMVESAFPKGDINRDEKVNSSDARLALRYSSRLISLDEEQLHLGDMNGDSKVNSSDARKILRIAAHLE